MLRSFYSQSPTGSLTIKETSSGYAGEAVEICRIGESVVKFPIVSR